MCKHGNTPNIECNTFALRLIPGTRQNNLRGDRLAFWNWANGYGDYGRKQKVVVVSVFWIEIGVYKFQIRESYEVRPKWRARSLSLSLFFFSRIKCIHLFQRARFYGDFRAQIDYHIEGLFYLSEDVPLDKWNERIKYCLNRITFAIKIVILFVKMRISRIF